MPFNVKESFVWRANGMGIMWPKDSGGRSSLTQLKLSFFERYVVYHDRASFESALIARHTDLH